MAKLIDSSSDNENDFHINESYAKKYEQWREKEELQKLKDRYEATGSSVSSSSSSESEDEYENWAFSNEKEFLKTLSLLKSKDPKIYDKNVSFFSTQDFKSAKHTIKSKPLMLKDYERNFVIERRYITDNEDEQEHQYGYFEEQRKLKEGFKTALKDLESNDEIFLHKGKKNKEFIEDKNLHNQKHDNINKESDLKFLCNSNLEPGEAFLKDYILNKRYLEKDDKIPTYEEIVNDGEGLSDDERILKTQEMFEHKFNFRFEEPDLEFIKRYPRTVKDSLRRKDNRRKQKREDYRKRKETEKMQKREDLKRLKALKRKEIEEKIEKLKEITGNTKIGFEEMDISQDFDPKKYDERMNEIFNDCYYADGEEFKPQFPPDDELDQEENWECSNEINVSVQYSVANTSEFIAETETSDINSRNGVLEKKKRKKSRFAEALAQKKPIFDPSLKSFEEYFDEYYKLDYEDIIGDMPCRFHYRCVVPNDFGLSTEEILSSKDKELNQWCSLKKVSQYRNEEEEYYDIQAFKKKGKNLALKEKILQSLYQHEKAGSQIGFPICNEQKMYEGNKYNHGKHMENNISKMPAENLQVKAKNNTELAKLAHGKSKKDCLLGSKNENHNGSKKANVACKQISTDNPEMKNKALSRIKNKRKFAKSGHAVNLCNERLTAYGINPKKYKNKLMYLTSNCA